MSTIASLSGLDGVYLVQLLVKVALVVTTAWALAWVLRGASAGTRHMVWTGAVVALLALPVLTMVLPRLEIPAARRLPLIGEVPAESWVPAPMGREIGPDEVLAQEGTGFAVVGLEADPPAVSVGEGGVLESSLDPWQLVRVVWFTGTVLLLLRLLAGTLGVRRFERDAVHVTDPEWARLLHDARWLLDVDRPIRLLRSKASSIPVTWGTLRPTVLLPANADEWSEDRKRVVLLHEVAHIARGDCFTQLLASIGTALYWIHPLAWVAARRLRVERERACDDLVLAAGEEPSEYASHLLEVARSFRAGAPMGAAAIAMARPSQLEGRLLALLDEARARSTPGRRTRLLGGSLAAVALIPFAAISIVEGSSEVRAQSSLLDGLKQLQRPELSGEPSAALSRSGEPPAPGSRLAMVPLDQAASAAVDTVVELRAAANPGGLVHLDVETGARISVTGWDRNEVHVRASLRGDRARDVQLTLQDTGGGVRLRSSYSRSSRGNSDHDFEIHVPARSNLEFRSSGGEFVVRSVNGSFEGVTGGGDIVLEQLSGTAHLQTGGGNVRVADSTLEGEVRTGGGNVRMERVLGGLAAMTGGGNISVSESGGSPSAQHGDPLTYATGGGNISVDRASSSVHLTTGGGSISIAHAAGAVEAGTGGGIIRLGQVVGPVAATTGAGEVHVERAEGSVDVATGAGAITVALAGGVRGADIELRSGDGTITLMLPSDFSGVFELEGSPNRRDWIQSDFELALDSRGHASGRVGDGANRVHIRAMNGNVVLRRSDRLGAGEQNTPMSTASIGEPVEIDFSEMSVTLDGLPEHLEVTLDGQWSQFAADAVLKAAEIAAAAVSLGLDAAHASIEEMRLHE